MPTFHRDMPTRFAVVPRRGSTEDIRWFEADPTYVLHWINAYEDGDWLVLDGFFQHDPMPGEARGHAEAAVAVPLDRPRPAAGPSAPLALQPRHRRDEGGVAVRPGDGVRDDQPGHRRQGLPLHVQHDRQARLVPVRRPREAGRATGAEERYAFGDGVFGSETPFAPRPDATAEDDGYLVTFTTDMNRDCSECLVFDAQGELAPGDHYQGPAPGADLQPHPGNGPASEVGGVEHEALAAVAVRRRW